ncbi:hypothetical protein SAMN05444266_109374 [Chitinophaga jiangningensis]|uniref:Uncharacterized protein n=1 Tax=Chitinophaga jiangningensis TaxID=1419482 RepID=A0A1M7KK13_9BACT|nr:hypothetical protein SAMN05444266_109374 [Chitinophaga jiangningensis]
MKNKYPERNYMLSTKKSYDPIPLYPHRTLRSYITIQPLIIKKGHFFQLP